MFLRNHILSIFSIAFAFQTAFADLPMMDRPQCSDSSISGIQRELKTGIWYISMHVLDWTTWTSAEKKRFSDSLIVTSELANLVASENLKKNGFADLRGSVSQFISSKAATDARIDIGITAQLRVLAKELIQILLEKYSC